MCKERIDKSIKSHDKSHADGQERSQIAKHGKQSHQEQQKMLMNALTSDYHQLNRSQSDLTECQLPNYCGHRNNPYIDPPKYRQFDRPPRYQETPLKSEPPPKYHVDPPKYAEVSRRQDDFKRIQRTLRSTGRTTFLCTHLHVSSSGSVAPALSQMEIGFGPGVFVGLTMLWITGGGDGGCMLRACVRACVRAGGRVCSDNRVSIRITVRPSPFEPSPSWKVGAATRSNGTNTTPRVATTDCWTTLRVVAQPLVLHRVKALRNIYDYTF
ncbi:hypothetical protein ALC57_06981 [Trachymyrmex cornetzi]|uniref:Uncharacterized protein n=1 Tax=Trachymyrmex cornetzi TaxID=471704 RepID=A0A195E749_9HYME|nr:hypothetical protein ALC57_06981 [Trachymyrmex cornetzi]